MAVPIRWEQGKRYFQVYRAHHEGYDLSLWGLDPDWLWAVCIAPDPATPGETGRLVGSGSSPRRSQARAEAEAAVRVDIARLKAQAGPPTEDKPCDP